MAYTSFSATNDTYHHDATLGADSKTFKFSKFGVEGWYYSNFVVTLTRLTPEVQTTFIATWENGSTGWSTNAAAWEYFLELQTLEGTPIWAIRLGFDRIQRNVEKNKSLQGTFKSGILAPYNGDFPLALFEKTKKARVYSQGDYTVN